MDKITNIKIKKPTHIHLLYATAHESRLNNYKNNNLFHFKSYLHRLHRYNIDTRYISMLKMK